MHASWKCRSLQSSLMVPKQNKTQKAQRQGKRHENASCQGAARPFKWDLITLYFFAGSSIVALRHHIIFMSSYLFIRFHYSLYVIPFYAFLSILVSMPPHSVRSMCVLLSMSPFSVHSIHMTPSVSSPSLPSFPLLSLLHPILFMHMRWSSVQNLCWSMTVGDYTTQDIGE